MRKTVWLASLCFFAWSGACLAQDRLEGPRVRPLAAPPALGKEAGQKELAPTPVLFPASPFPPPAPLVLDPRTGAWQQARGAAQEDGLASPALLQGTCCIGPGRRRNLLEKILNHFCHRPVVAVPQRAEAHEGHDELPLLGP
jgi:hypothetical protein